MDTGIVWPMLDPPETDMCGFCKQAVRCRPLTRRGMMQFAAATAATFATFRRAHTAKLDAPPKPENLLSPEAALDRLMKGNVRIVDDVNRRHDFKHEREPLTTGQNPFAAVLSCADSRIAPEYCFDKSRGDIFVCRVAGNIASDEMIASLECTVSVVVRSMQPSNRLRTEQPFRDICHLWLMLLPQQSRLSRIKAAICLPMRFAGMSASTPTS